MAELTLLGWDKDRIGDGERGGELSGARKRTSWINLHKIKFWMKEPDKPPSAESAVLGHVHQGPTLVMRWGYFRQASCRTGSLIPLMFKDVWGAGSFSTKCSRFSTSFLVKFSIGLRSSTTRSRREKGEDIDEISSWQRRPQKHCSKDWQREETWWVA